MVKPRKGVNCTGPFSVQALKFRVVFFDQGSCVGILELV